MVRLSLLQTSDAHEVSPAWMPTGDLNKDDTNRQANMDGGCSGGLNRSQPRNAENGRSSVPVEEHTSGLSGIKWSALKMYTYMSHKHMEN